MSTYPSLPPLPPSLPLSLSVPLSFCLSLPPSPFIFPSISPSPSPPPLTDQRNMGMSMKVEKSTLEQVKKRFSVVQDKKAEAKKQYGERERKEGVYTSAHLFRF